MRISDCDIIYDLLPSYLDGVCTETTRRCVEEHLADCPACEARARRLRETALTGEHLERVALDAARRIKRRTIRRTAVQLLLTLPFLLLGGLAFNLCAFGRGQIGGVFICQRELSLLLAACLLVSALLPRGGDLPLQKRDFGALAVSLLAMAASTALMVWGFSFLMSGSLTPEGLRTPLGVLRPESMGQLFLRLYGLLTLVQIAVCLWAAARLCQSGVRSVPVFQTALTGAALPLAYLLTLRSMNLDFPTAVEEVMLLELRDTAVLLALGLGGVLLGFLTAKWRAGKKKDLPF